MRDEVALALASTSGLGLNSTSTALGATSQDSAPGPNVVNGESTPNPNPVPENLFSQKMQPNSGSRADVRLVGAVGGGVLFVLWVGVFRLVG